MNTVGDVTLVKFVARYLDESNIHAIGDQLFHLVEKMGCQQLCLDFSNVELVTGTGLGKLVTLHKKVQALGGRLSLYNLNPLIYEVFEITRLTTVLDIQRGQEAVGAA